MHMRPFERPNIADPLDDANQALIAVRISANRAGIGTVEIAAARATPHRTSGVRKSHRERQHADFRRLQQTQGGTTRAARAEPRQFRQQSDQPLDFRAAHPLRTAA